MMRANLEMIGYSASCLVWVAILAVFGVENRADEQSSPSNRASLSELLLGNLDRELIAKPPAPPSPTEPENDGDRRVASDVAGEDLRGPSWDDALNTIERQMREVQRRLKHRDVAVGTQRLQERIIKRMDVLLQGSGRSPGQSLQRSPRGQTSSTDKQSGDASAAAADSTNRLASDGATPMNAQSLETWLKKTWGHLPARLRTPMLNSAVEQFLPQYQALIEDYYRRLAEDQSDNR
jgi:hypothetical protein